MKAVQLMEPRVVEVAADVPEPALCEGDDCIVEVEVAGICGTDLHPYRGHIPGFAPGTVMGHEFVGTVVEAGGELTKRRVGDRVVVSDIVACGRCALCATGRHYQCSEVQLFGYDRVVGDYLPGGQAEFVRVPHADLTTFDVPPGVTPHAALFAGDVLTTALAAVEAAAGESRDSLAVVGCGPVGLAAVLCGRWAGFEQVVAIDDAPLRRAAASTLGATPLNGGKSVGTALPVEDAVRDVLQSRGASAVVEAVGASAALATSIEIAAPNARIASVGAHHGDGTPIPLETAFGRELTIQFVVGNPLALAPRVLGLMAADELDPTPIISDVIPLDDAPAGYMSFDHRQAIKVLLEP